MTLWGIFRFEIAYQLRRPWPWLSMAVLLVFALVSTRVAIVPVRLPQDSPAHFAVLCPHHFSLLDQSISS